MDLLSDLRAETAAAMAVISGPFPPSPTVRFCDIGGERLPSSDHWWLVRATDQSWEADRGASCATHCCQTPVPAPAHRPARHKYSQGIK